mgnify:CR=1 FL=1
MKKSVRVTERILAVIMTAALVLSVCAVPTFAAEASGASASAASFVNASYKVSLSHCQPPAHLRHMYL